MLCYKNTYLLLFSLALFSCNSGTKPADKSIDKPAKVEETLSLKDIRIRDPFIVADKSSENYYMYARMSNREGATEKGVEVYASKDLESWTGPEPVFTFPDGFWANYQVWAPEVHSYRDKYYLFVTLSNSDTLATPRPHYVAGWPELVQRATQIFVADALTGPFKPFDNKPHTPVEWSSLDGTLYVEDGTPFMVFCHEWTQIVDGSMELVKLKEDLSDTDGEPVTLFHAGDAPWVTPLFQHGKITDGPFLYTTQSGKLIMIWSSFGVNKYAIGQAVSESGKIAGPWTQGELIFHENGGHGMIFRTFEGQLMLSFHQPNTNGLERAQFYKLREVDDRLVLDDQVASGNQ